MRKMFVVLVEVFVLVLFSESCRDHENKNGMHEILYINNKSGMDLYFEIVDCDTLMSGYDFFKDNSFLIKDNERTKMYKRGGYEQSIKFCSRFCILFFDASLKGIPFDTVWKHEMFDYRKIYTLDQLDSLDWTITVP